MGRRLTTEIITGLLVAVVVMLRSVMITTEVVYAQLTGPTGALQQQQQQQSPPPPSQQQSQ
jgi:hypothetical protein